MTQAPDWSVAFTEHSDAVYHLALVVLRCPEDARDVMQTAFERAWRHRHRYDPSRSMRNWLLAIASHEAISTARRRRLVRWVTLSGEERGREAPLDLSLTLWQAIGTLSPGHRAVVGLFHLHGFSIEEIAELLDIPGGTVASRLHTARRRLQALLEAQPEEIRT
jgi:RNA polymerase sigma-70 factor, ECF subfamily